MTITGLPCIYEEGVERGDVGVVQIRLGAGFRAETLHDGGITREIGIQDFDGDGTVQMGFESAVDGTHTAFAELRLDQVIFNLRSDHGTSIRLDSIRLQAQNLDGDVIQAAALFGSGHKSPAGIVRRLSGDEPGNLFGRDEAVKSIGGEHQRVARRQRDGLVGEVDRDFGDLMPRARVSTFFCWWLAA